VVGNIAGCSVRIFSPDTSACWDGNDRVVPAGAPTIVDVSTKSAYILDTIKLSPQWIVTGGVRIDDYSIEQDAFNSAGVQTSHLERHDRMLNYNGGITWKPLPNGSVYASIGTSTNPVGQEMDAGGDDYGGLTARAQVYAPEKNTAVELGTKWELFDRNLLVTAAAFQTTKANAREVVGAGPSAQLLDTGEYRVRGIELGFAGNVTSALSLYGGAAFMNSEITKSSVATNLGKDFANIAHTTFNMMAKYKLTDRLTIGGAATYAGEIKGGTFAATNGNVLPSHWRFDALAEFEVSRHMDLQLNVINITDELYYDAFYRSPSPYVYVAPGRAAYLTAKFKY
jgi:catecholate siderophore receptor